MLIKIITPIVAIAAVLALAGCDKTLKTDSIEPQIQKTLTAQGIKVTKVECPGDVTAKKGDKFECTVTTADGATKIEVTQTDDNGHVTFRPSDVQATK